MLASRASCGRDGRYGDESAVGARGRRRRRSSPIAMIGWGVVGHAMTAGGEGLLGVSILEYTPSKGEDDIE